MSPIDPNSPVSQLSDRFWEAVLELNPTTATVYGDERYNDRLEDPSPAGRAKTRELLETVDTGRPIFGADAFTPAENPSSAAFSRPIVHSPASAQ